ncbi:gamma-aminobutyric acid receptor subunit beta-3-like [Branchiostoma floridae]|uniref:Gamma-aminobutyric acid receptor subunit beta n=1 Tax=Branchiostoma floridae TaxID=7739 RepID=A0A9J7KWP5_BRAFL|nr:gamma-aminobutyric acid receptor subunit beta-3-like [Branchiostoma floridae]
MENLLQRRGYDRFLRPNFGREPVHVNLSLTVASIDLISEVNMDYTITIFLRQYWQDGRMSFEGTNLTTLSLDGRLAENLWLPDTFISNSKESFLHKVTVDNRLIQLYPNGTILYGIRITTKAECYMDLKKYPMDSQNCSLEFESYGYRTDDIIFHWKAGNSSVHGLDTLKLQQFIVGGYYAHDGLLRDHESGVYSRIKLSFILHRQAFYFIFQTYIPSILLVVLSWVSFWINPEAVPARVALGITTVLTMTTLMSGAQAQMPKISYIKAIDVYLVMCFLFTFFALVEYAAVNFVSSKMALKRKKQENKDVEKLECDCEECNTSQQGISLKRLSSTRCRLDRGTSFQNNLVSSTSFCSASTSFDRNCSAKTFQVDIDETSPLNGPRGESNATSPSNETKPSNSREILEASDDYVTSSEENRPTRIQRCLSRGLSYRMPRLKDAIIIDQYARFGFPFTFAALNIVYFTYYSY